MSPPEHRPLLGRAPRARRPLILLIAVGALALTACTTSTTSAGGEPPVADGAFTARSSGDERRDAPTVRTDDRPATVAMVGDSITAASDEALRHRFEQLGLEVVAVDAVVNRRMTIGERGRFEPGIDVVDAISRFASPEVWVVALGTNDIGQYPDHDTVVEHVETLLATIPADVPVLWVDTWVRNRPEETELVNRAIRSAVADRPGASVVSWSDAAPDDGVISGDGVHLTDTVGVERFAEVVTAGLGALIGPAS